MVLRSRRLSLGLGLGALSLMLVACGGSGGSSSSSSDRSKAIADAAARFSVAKSSGADLSKGPCLAEKLAGLPDWVVDVAHNPRRKVDDNPANQCARYVSGAAHHFVELDPNGKLIRAQ